MPRKDGRIEPGQPLKSAISASAWNRAQDAADVVLGQRPGFSANGVQGPPLPYTTVLCRNDSGSNVPRWGVLAINGVAITPSGPSGPATATFQEQPVVVGTTPTASTQAMCVAVEPIKASGVGRVAVHGVVQVKLDVIDSTHTFARCKASTSELITDFGGPTHILWKESGTGAGKWALARIGSGLPTGVTVVTNVTISATGVVFDRQKVWALATTGAQSIAIAATGC